MTRAGSLAELRRLAEAADRVLFVPKGPTGKLPDGGVPFVLPSTILALLDLLTVERLSQAIDASMDEWFEGNVDDWAMQSADVASAAILKALAASPDPQGPSDEVAPIA